MNSLRKIFIRGLVALVPIVVTIALIVWVFGVIEDAFGFVIKQIIGPQYYFNGLGVLVGLVLIFVVGVIMNAFIAQKLYNFGERLLNRIPLVKSLYRAIRDLMGFFQTDPSKSAQRVVMVSVGKLRFIGFVTRENLDDLPPGMSHPNQVAVFVPLSYQIGGHLLIVPRDSIEAVPDLTVEAAMRFAVTAGMTSKQEELKAFQWPWKKSKKKK